MDVRFFGSFCNGDVEVMVYSILLLEATGFSFCSTKRGYYNRRFGFLRSIRERGRPIDGFLLNDGSESVGASIGRYFWVEFSSCDGRDSGWGWRFQEIKQDLVTL